MSEAVIFCEIFDFISEGGKGEGGKDQKPPSPSFCMFVYLPPPSHTNLATLSSTQPQGGEAAALDAVSFNDPW